MGSSFPFHTSPHDRLHHLLYKPHNTPRSSHVKNTYALAVALTFARLLRTSNRCCKDDSVSIPAKVALYSSIHRTYLLPQPQNLEPLKVGQSPPLGALRPALGPGGVLPLGVHLVLLPLLLDGSSAGALGEVRQHNVREGELRECCGVAGDDPLGVG